MNLLANMPNLFDPRKPWLWNDGSKRSQDNGFTLGLTGQPLDLREFQTLERAKRVAARQVAKLRAKGVDQSVMALKHRRRKPAKT